jgi:hypothetical protein
MIQHVTYVYRFNLGIAERLVADLTPAQMVMQPSGVVNHPAWSLGHLVLSSNGLAKLLGLPSQAPDGWDSIFATGGIPSGDEADYPSKAELLEALAAQHERNTGAVLQADPASFAAPHPDERLRKYFPTVGDVVTFLMTSHETSHQGQVSAWRRAAGLGPPARP